MEGSVLIMLEDSPIWWLGQSNLVQGYCLNLEISAGCTIEQQGARGRAKQKTQQKKNKTMLHQIPSIFYKFESGMFCCTIFIPTRWVSFLNIYIWAKTIFGGKLRNPFFAIYLVWKGIFFVEKRHVSAWPRILFWSNWKIS